MKLRDAKGEVTLRVLPTHTTGMAYDWNHPNLRELHQPSDGSPPNKIMPVFIGDIQDFEVPLVTEPNKEYTYGFSAEWLGQFAVRSSGKTFRQLFKEIVSEPLHIPSSEADLWISPSRPKARVEIYARDPDNGFTHIPFSQYMTGRAARW